MIHGGFWRRRYGRAIQWPAARDLQARGWAVWNVEYRRLGGGGGWPHTFEDVAAAVDLLADHADGLDLERVVALGHSAGGQLALWAAARPQPAVRVAGAVAQGGVLDLNEAERLGVGDGAARDLLGGGPDEFPDRYADASPIERVPIGVPAFLVHGEADERVPVAMSSSYAEAARGAGDAIDVALRPGEDHFVHLDVGGGAWADVVRWLERFG
jgi:acetyl esterase/lipase